VVILITNLHDEDWDLMILLDACRLDSFKRYNQIKGDLQVFKTASSTSDFVHRFFKYDQKYDIAYISANPYIHDEKVFGQMFKEIKCVWDYGWDWVNHTVHPAVMSSEIFKAVEKYPDTRILSHWIQPHHPFIGEFRLPYEDCLPNSVHEARTTIWHRLWSKEVTLEDFKRAYESNLVFALKYVAPIVNQLHKRRKIVITADHGNCFGEDGIYGHPTDSEHPILTEVPWLIVDW